MMLQHSTPTLADISGSAAVPSPLGTLTLDDLADFSPVDELRLAIRSTQRSSGLNGEPSSDGSSSGSDRGSKRTAGGTGEAPPEDDERRRRRRRERNKIAAAKCRNKKKEKTESLQKESEKLESVNAELKSQIQDLKQQKQQLVYMLNLHRPTCIVRVQTPEDEQNLFLQQVQETRLQLHALPVRGGLLDTVQCHL